MTVRKIDASRQRRINRVIGQLQDAIEHAPFLARLPGGREVARIARCSTREAFAALEQLQHDGQLKVSGWGYRVVRRPTKVERLKTVVLAQIDPKSFTNWIAFGADRRCRQSIMDFQNRWIGLQRHEEAVGRLGKELPGADVGWIFTFPPRPDWLAAWLDEGRRTVLVDCDTPQVAVSQVLLNHIEAMKLAEGHLASLGHRRLGRIFQRNFTLERFMPNEGVWFPTDWNVWFRAHQREQELGVVTGWLDRWRAAARSKRPTAVLLYNLELAETFLRACQILRIQVPDELSVVGFGSRPGRDPETPMTFASSGAAVELGEQAVELLVHPKELAEHRVLALPTELVNPTATVRRRRR